MSRWAFGVSVTVDSHYRWGSQWTQSSQSPFVCFSLGNSQMFSFAL